MTGRHTFTDQYPFALPAPEPREVGYQRTCRHQPEIDLLQLKLVLLQEMLTPYIIKLLRATREGHKITFVYEYHGLSLTEYIRSGVQQEFRELTRGVYEKLVNMFEEYIHHLIRVLTHFQIKVSLAMDCIAVSRSKESLLPLKYFLSPNAEFMVVTLPQKDDWEIRLLIKKNRTELKEFYEGEKYRMTAEFEEMLELVFGKVEDSSQHANFVIRGSQLVFLPTAGQKQPKSHGRNSSFSKMESTELRNKIFGPAPPVENNKKAVKEKYESRMNDIKANLRKIELKRLKKQKMNGDLKGRKQSHEEIMQPSLPRYRPNSVCEDIYPQIENLAEQEKKIEIEHSTREERDISKDNDNECLMTSYDRCCSDERMRTEGKAEEKKQGTAQKFKMKITISQNAQVVQENQEHNKFQISSVHENNKTIIAPKGIDQFTETELLALCHSAIEDHIEEEIDRTVSPTITRNSDIGPNYFSMHKNISQGQIKNPSGIWRGSQPVQYEYDSHMTNSAKVNRGEYFASKVWEAKQNAESLIKKYNQRKK